MARFKPLPESDMSEAQRQVVREIVSGPRGAMVSHGPSALFLRSPGLLARTHKVGEYLRYHSALPPHLRELTILITARLWNTQVIWFEHHALALKAGLNPNAAADLAQGRQPNGLRDDEAAVYRFCTELHRTRRVSDATFDAVAKHLGESGVIDLIGLTGYYSMLAMALNVAQQPLPAGATPVLPVDA